MIFPYQFTKSWIMSVFILFVCIRYHYMHGLLLMQTVTYWWSIYVVSFSFFFPFCNFNEPTMNNYVLYICHYCKYTCRINLYKWIAGLKDMYKLTQSCLTLCDPMNCSLPGSSVHGILQATILEWVTMPSSRGSSQPRGQTWVSRIAGICTYNFERYYQMSIQKGCFNLNLL